MIFAVLQYKPTFKPTSIQEIYNLTTIALEQTSQLNALFNSLVYPLSNNKCTAEGFNYLPNTPLFQIGGNAMNKNEFFEKDPRFRGS